MCHSYDASLAALAVGWTGCIMLMLTNKLINFRIGLFFMYVLSMQLIEAIMWKDQSCKGNNQLASKIGFIQNIGQPIFAFIALKPFIKNTELNIVIFALSLYIASLGLFIIKNKTQLSLDSFWCTRAGEAGLEWNWARSQDLWVWSSFVISLALTMFSSKLSIYTSIATFGTLVASYILKYGNSKAVGSWWCFYAVILPYVQLITQ